MNSRIFIYGFVLSMITAACVMKEMVEYNVGNDGRMVLEMERWVDEVGVDPIFTTTNINFYRQGYLCEDFSLDYFISGDICDRDKLHLINGICFHTTRYTNIVLMSDRWKHTFYERELLLHELAHCLYDIRHIGDGDTPEDIKIMADSGWKAGPLTIEYETCKLINFIREKYGKSRKSCN